VLQINFALEIGGLTEDVQVTAESPIIDVKQNAAGATIQKEILDLIPKARDYTDAVKGAPGTNPEGRGGGIMIDGAGGSENRFVVDGLDTTGALFLRDLGAKPAELTGLRPDHKALLDFISSLDTKPLPRPRAMPRWRELVIALGRHADAAWHDAHDIVHFLGWTASATLKALVRPRYLKLASISRQVAETGINALPIIGLLAVMISIVIAYQAIVQLRPYGGEEFTVNLVAVSVLREMGVLITAIMVAGRTGSAFTAELGVMKAREEIAALQVMGMEPMEMLVVPRLVGLVMVDDDDFCARVVGG